MSELPDFIPQAEPAQTVTDLSGKLSPAQLSELNSLDSKLQYKARVLIMPSSYKAESDQQLKDLGEEVGKAWNVEGSTLLMLIDLSGRKIRIVAGPEMAQTGVTNHYLQSELLPVKFYPQVKLGNVHEAIFNSLIAIQIRREYYRYELSRGTRGGVGGTNAPAQPLINTQHYGSNNSDYSNFGSQSSTLSDYGGIFLAGTVVVLGSAFFVLKNKSDREKNVKLTQTLTESLGKLYKLADELGQASEYMPPGSNKDLALQVSAFFQKLETVNKAKDEIDKLSLAKHWGKANDALNSGLKLSDALTAEGEKLLTQVSAITGGVDSLKPDSVKTPEMPHKVRVDMPYTRPSWSYEPEYSQPIFVNSGPSTGILDMLFLLNSMNSGNIFTPGNSYTYSDTSSSDSSFSNSSFSNSSVSDSSDFTVDTGGSWDSGSNISDSSSSDSGSSDSGSSDSSSGGSW